MPLDFKTSALGFQLSIPRKKIICAVSSRKFNYDFRHAKGKSAHANIQKNRERFLNNLGLDLANAVFLEQVHKSRVCVAGLSFMGKGAFDYPGSVKGVDAAITNVPGMPLCVLSADCLPLIFFDHKKQVIGIAHAGWKGTQLKVARRVVSLMIKKFSCAPANVQVIIGPGIRGCCYDVGPEFKGYFERSIRQRQNKLFFDLAGENIDQLIQSGISRSNIFDPGICTSCRNAEFFSYRSGDRQLRMLSLVCLTS